MKNLKLLALGLLLSLAGCNNDDDNNSAATLEGTWKLTRVQGGFGGADEQFSPGAITWTFDFDTQKVSVVNNLDPESEWDFFETGLYDFEVLSTNEPQECGTSVIIDGMDFGCPEVGSQTLKLDHQVADGFLVTLKR